MTNAIVQKSPNQLIGARPTKAAAKLDLDLGGMPINRLSLDRNVLTIITAQGEKKTPNDGKLYGVFLAASQNVHRLTWAKTYDRQNPTPPDCFSEDDVRPHPKVEQPYSDVCATCDRNQKGSAENGGRACKYSLPMVFLPVARDGDTFRIQGVPILFRVNSVSLFGETLNDGRMGLKHYQAFLKGNGVSLSEVVTCISMDVNAEHPSTAVFEHVAWADDGMQEVMTEVLTNKGDDIKRMVSIEGSVGGEDMPAPPPGDIVGGTEQAAPQQQAPAPQQQAPAPQQQAPAPQQQAPAPQQTQAAPENFNAETGEVLGGDLDLNLDAPTAPPATADDMVAPVAVQEQAPVATQQQEAAPVAAQPTVETVAEDADLSFDI